MRKIDILMVEDNEDDAFLVKRHLHQQGLDFRVERVETADSFRNQLQSQEWDLILSDYSLPGFSGVKALQILSEMDRDIPFILVSGAIGEHMAVEAMRAGAQDYILKDNLARLVPVIERELQDAKERKALRMAERRKRTLEVAFQQVLWGTAASVGEDFFHSLVQSLAKTQGFKAAVVAEYVEGGKERRVLACHGFDSPCLSDKVEGSLAELILVSGKVSMVDSDFGTFSDGAHLRQVGIKSAIGVRLDSRTGEPQGLLLILHDQTLDDPDLAMDLVSIFAARAGSELDRIDAERHRRDMELQLFQSQKLEAVGTLAAGIAHDINNILTSIWGHAQLLEMSVTDEFSTESVAGIMRGCRRARDLARGILLFGRKQEVALAPLVLSEIVGEVHGLMRSSIPQGIEFKTDIPAHLPLVLGDAGQLHQVFLNLCTNALHAMSGQAGSISVVARSVPEKSQVLIEVSDQGTGIPPEALPRIFEPFFTTKPVGKGTGLGLSVVHGIIKNHQGSISVHNRPGEGATFEILLPALEQDPETSEISSVVDLPQSEGRSVMVVDDEETVSEVLGQFLTILGLPSETFSDPRAAIASFRADPDRWLAVVSDLTMPEISGIDLAQIVHGIRPQLPFLLTSGFESEEAASEEIQRHISGFLPKPFQLEDLDRAIRKAIARG